jgi:protein-S-isoprenylcysteine O-methyltransferase Ste14
VTCDYIVFKKQTDSNKRRMLTDLPFYLSHLVLVLSWMMFAIIHHVMATERFKLFAQHLLQRRYRYYRLLYCGVAFTTLAAVLCVEFLITSPIIPISKTIAIAIAIPTGLVGGLLMVTCLLKYFHRISGVAALKREHTEHRLETAGVHKHVRHPLYLGTLLFIWALFLLNPLLCHLIGCVAVTIYVCVGISSEERKLVKIFGEDYIRYQQTTPKLIPRLSRRIFQNT